MTLTPSMPGTILRTTAGGLASLGLLAALARLAIAPLGAQEPPRGLARMLEADLARYPARTGIYVKHLGTGEEAAVRGDESFSSASVIKIPIMIRMFQLADAGALRLDDRVEIGRAELRDGSGVLQYHDLGQRPTLRDLITEMVITSDNTATDLLTLKVGGVETLNRWLAESGYANTRMIGRGFEYRRKLLALLDPQLAGITPEETTGLQYAMQGNALFELYEPLFTGPRAAWLATVRDPAKRQLLAARRNTLTVEDRDYWLGDMTPRETGRLLESIARDTAASPASSRTMRVIMGRQQAGSRRLPHYLDVPVAHKTGDSAVIANDVGLISARSGTIVVAVFVNGIRGPIGETEDRIGLTARRIVDYFDGPER